MIFNYLPDDRFHNIFHMREDHTGELLIDDMEIHFMELAKLESKAHKMDSRLVNWLMFIHGANQDRWEELAMDTPGLKKAMTTLAFLSQDKEARMLYEMRRKALLNEQSALDYAEAKGKAAKGREIVVNMLEKGLSISLIAEVTGLSEAEIEAFSKQLH